MKNTYALLISTLISFQATKALAADCKLYVLSKGQIETPDITNPELKELAKTANKILKKSYEILYTIDRATLGIATSLATGGHFIENLKPEQWDKFNVVGNLIYQESAFSNTALRGAKLTFTEGKTSRTVITGAQGEFAESFSKLVSYSRLRLFGSPAFEIRNQSVPIVKIPVTVKLESKFCTAETTLDAVPLEPMIFIASTSEKL